MNLFIVRMKKELEANKGKGDFEKWNPSPEIWLWEIQYHLAKLQKAIKDNNKDLICEHSADVANYAYKSYSLYGKPYECRECDGKGTLIYDSPYESTCIKCNGKGLIDNDS